MIDISVQNLVKAFEVGKNIIDGLSMEIEAGERVCLLGRNGAGKTTLFRLLTGELSEDEGNIAVIGPNVAVKAGAKVAAGVQVGPDTEL